MRWKAQEAAERAQSCKDMEEQFCNPTTLKEQANGLTYGVSSLRYLPTGTFSDLNEVSGGDEALWDYTKFSKVGQTFPGFNKDYFVIYDVVLSEEMVLLNVHTHRWTLVGGQIGRPRRENCPTGSGSDSPGIDCSSPPAAINIGYARDASLPSPLLISLPDALVPGVSIQGCDKIGGFPLDCQRTGKLSFELYTHTIYGERLCFRESSQLHLKMQKSSEFPAVNDIVVPMMSKSEHFCMSGYFWHRYHLIAHHLRDWWDGVLYPIAMLLWCLLWMCFYGKALLGWKKLSVEEDGEKCCQ